MIILLHGTINAGKSTTANWLSELMPRTAHIEVDALRAFIPSVPLFESIPLNLENAVSVAANLVRRGFHVVISYPLRPEDHAYLSGALGGLGVPVHTVTLHTTIDNVTRNRGARELTEWEVARIHEMYAEGYPDWSWGHRIDNSGQTPRETAERIITLLSTV